MKKVTVILKRGNQNWILGAFAKDIRRSVGARLIYFPMKRRQLWTLFKYKILFKPEGLLIILHQELFYYMKRVKINFDNCELIIFYTHNYGLAESDLRNFQYLRFVDKVVVASTETKNFLVATLGTEISKKVKVVIGGADVSHFRRLKSNKDSRSVILVGRVADRKRPDLIYRTVLENGDFSFSLHGSKWKNSLHLNLLNSCSNFHYYEFNFKNSNVLYNQNNIFLSLSDIEGGPIPALEALASGCKVILTDTGFARDLKSLSNSVVLIPINPTSSEVTLALNKCLDLPDPELGIVENFRYDHFLKQLTEINHE
jgi:glycosyltransferase involved in cell wall biosynthesis